LKIFISYRRDDTLAIAGRIYDRLRHHFGQRSVFMDLDAIPIGEDFREVIQDAIKDAHVLLALIGPDWFGSAENRQRLEDPKDFVRAEIEAALNQEIPVIPILLDNAAMPSAQNLPSSLELLSFRNALHIDSGKDFEVHMERLVNALESLAMGHKGAPSILPHGLKLKWKQPVMVGVGLCLAVAGGLLFPRIFNEEKATIHPKIDPQPPVKESTPESGYAKLQEKKVPSKQEIAAETKKEEMKIAKGPAPKKSVESNEMDKLQLVIMAKTNEIGEVLVSTCLPTANGFENVEISTDGKQIVVKFKIKANNLVNGAQMTLRVSTQGVEGLSIRQGSEDVYIFPGLDVDARRKVETILKLSK
jgi:hypothetical protein